MIYICIDYYAFEICVSKENEVVCDLKCEKDGETNWIGRYLIRAKTWWSVYEAASLLIEVSIISNFQGWFVINVQNFP